MNFIEKISQLRVNWDGQSAFRIDDVFQLINEADENYCLMKNEILSFPLLNNGNGNITIDRISLQQYWNSDCTVGSKILITLFWGGLHKTQNFQSSFIREIDKNMNLIYGFEKDFFDKGIEELFKDFESENKIEGVGYAFFSKFFQFAIPNSSFIICDQWTMKAVASYLISNKNYLKLNEIFTLSINNKNQINIGLRQKNKSVYKSYLLFIEVFHEITRELTLVLNRIGNDVRVAEEILFGWDRRIKNDEYDNPRHYYQEILYTYLNS